MMLVVPLLVSISAKAQDRQVTGKVTDSKDGKPLSGVTILVTGTNIGTQTNAEGAFSVRASTGATTLTVSFVGYTTQEVAIGNGSISVALVASAVNLNEVVVIGYGTSKKKDLTGSVATVSSKDFVKGAITSPEQLISGKVAGVSITSNGGAPGSGSTIRIRGGASLNASNDPLIVIDGMPLSNDGISGVANPLSLINPNDIETFSVLKDASATAIYGSRASNGVIMITTKKGKRGKPVINFTSQVSAATPFNKVDVLSADQVRQIVKQYGTPDLIALLGKDGASTNWQNEIYQTAIAEDNNLSVSGAIKNFPYRLSVGYLNQDGILRTDNLKRVSAGINLSPMLFNNHLKIELNLRGVSSNSRFANQGAIGAAVTFDPTQPIYSGSSRFGGYWEWLDPNTTTGLKSLAPLNPLGILYQTDDESHVLRSIGNIMLDYKLHFFPDLHAILNTGFDISRGAGLAKIPDSAAMAYRRSPDQKYGGVYNEYKQKVQNTYLNFYFNYLKEIKSIDSRIEALAGYEFQDYKTTNYFYPDRTWDGYATQIITRPKFTSDEPEYVLISFLGRLTYTFKNRYIITGSLRRDGSSKFNPDNRWGMFPSGAIAWRIKEEPFLKNVSAISDLKIRAGYGVTGQQDGIGYYDYLPRYSYSSSAAQYQFGNNFYELLRPAGYYFNRQWEQTATTNLAIDYGFINNRISGSIEVYQKKTTRLLNEIDQPAGTNFSNKIIANIGDMENKGIELTINFQPIRNKNFTWDVAFNATYNENKITKLTVSDNPNYPGAKFGGIGGGVGNTILINTVNYNRGAFYVYKQVYDQAGKPIDNLFDDLNRDGIINQNDLYQYKGVDPKAFFGFSTSITHKQWSAGLVARANLGNYLYSNTALTGTLRNIINPLGFINSGSVDYLSSGFSGTGDKYFLSDYYVQNASFLRLDNINIGYNAGKIFNKKANLRLSANVQNVFVITRYKGLDPEINGGIDNNFYPRPRTFVFGVNLDF